MTRNEKVEHIKDHAYGLALAAVEYAKASERLESLEEWQINILLEIGDALLAAQQVVRKKYDFLIRKTNN